jgi:hypothetical protein
MRFEDIEGRPLSAPFVAGRRVVGGDDEAIRPADFDAITKAATGGSARSCQLLSWAGIRVVHSSPCYQAADLDPASRRHGR